MEKSLAIFLALALVLVVPANAITGTVLQPRVIKQVKYPSLVTDSITIRNDNNHTISYEVTSSIITKYQKSELDPGDTAKIHYTKIIWSASPTVDTINIKFIDDNTSEIIALSSKIIISPKGTNWLLIGGFALLVVVVMMVWLMLKRGDKGNVEKHRQHTTRADNGQWVGAKHS